MFGDDVFICYERCRNLGEMKRILDVSKEDEPSSKVQKSVDLSSSTHPKVCAYIFL